MLPRHHTLSNPLLSVHSNFQRVLDSVITVIIVMTTTHLSCICRDATMGVSTSQLNWLNSTTFHSPNLTCRHAASLNVTLLQLQVAVGTQEAVKALVTEVSKLKQDMTNIKSTRLQLQQQTGMLAELR